MQHDSRKNLFHNGRRRTMIIIIVKGFDRSGFRTTQPDIEYLNLDSNIYFFNLDPNFIY